MNVVRTVLRLKPKESKKKKNVNTFNNEFYIASNEFSKQKLISFYGIEDCAITSGHGSCMKLESIFGASTISRGSSSTLAYSNTTLNNSAEESLDNIKKYSSKSYNKEIKTNEKLKKDNNNNKKSKKANKKNKNDKEIEREESSELECDIKKKRSIIGNQNETIDNTINELKLKLMERNSKNDINNKSNLNNNLTSSETIYRESNNNSIDYLSSNPNVVIDINSLKAENNNHSTYLNRSNSNVHINNINIHEEEKKEEAPKKEITIDIDTNTKVAKLISNEVEPESETEKINNNNNNKMNKKLNKNSSCINNVSEKDQHIIQIGEKCKSEESLCSSSNINSNNIIKNSKSYDRFTPINDSKSYKNKLSHSTGNNIFRKSNIFDNQNKVFLNKLVDRYSPQKCLSVSFNHLYDPLFVSNNFSKRYDMELKYVDLSVKDIYEHGLPYLLRSKRPLIEFCKELIKETQIEVLFFVNEVCNFQKKLFMKQSDILIDGKEIYEKYLSQNAICPLEVSQSLKLQCVKDLKSLKKECFHAISLNFYKDLDFIFEEFKDFVLKEHYENKTEFDSILVTQKTEAEKKGFEDELIKLVEIYYKSNDEALKRKQEYIIECTKKLCNNLLN